VPQSTGEDLRRRDRVEDPARTARFTEFVHESG
jgi:hypothetical protein